MSIEDLDRKLEVERLLSTLRSAVDDVETHARKRRWGLATMHAMSALEVIGKLATSCARADGERAGIRGR